MALVGHEQSSAASHPQVVAPKAVYDTDDDVAGREASGLAVAEATDQIARRENGHHVAVPLVHQLDGGHDDEHLTSSSQFIGCCRHAEHRLAGSRHRLDHATMLCCLPTNEGIALPRVQTRTIERCCPATRDLRCGLDGGFAVSR